MVQSSGHTPANVEYTSMPHETPSLSEADQALSEDADLREIQVAEKRRTDAARKAQSRIKAQSSSSVFVKLLSVARKHGAEKKVLIEPEGREISYGELIQASFALGSAFSKFTTRGEMVGVLLPTSAGAMIGFFALQCAGRVPAMLNFTAGTKNLFSALKTGQIKTIITAHKFVEQADVGSLIEELNTKAKIVYLEDIRENLGKLDKVRALIGPKFPWLIRRPVSPDSPGAVLFTSGTEGEPKGVVLSQQNLLANVAQIASLDALEEDDIVFNPLPIFHSYGLTAGCLFPMLEGKPVVCYPSPLHVKIIPELIRRTGATIMFATDTFLHRYLKSAKEGALATMRYAICGAEHVRDETRTLARTRFGFHVLEGYGVTEATPVLAVNQPGDIRPGTVGQMLPGVETRLEPVDGLESGGRLYVRGPNIMSGYLDFNEPGKINKPVGGWHDTGDIVNIDGGGYMSIQGRVKRFAKLGGEMISLAVVENCASVVWPDYLHAAVSLPDRKKGEQIILLTENPAPDRASLLHWAQSHGVPELAVPRKLFTVDSIPVLGSGKLDYVKLGDMAKEAISSD